MFYFMVANPQLYLYCLGAFVFMENIIPDGFEKNVPMYFWGIVGAMFMAKLVKKGLISMSIAVNQMKEDIIRSLDSIRDMVDDIGKVVRLLDDDRRGKKDEIVQSQNSVRGEVDDGDVGIPKDSDQQRGWSVSEGEPPGRQDFCGMIVTKRNCPKILKKEELENPIALSMHSMENKEEGKCHRAGCRFIHDGAGSEDNNSQGASGGPSNQGELRGQAIVKGRTINQGGQSGHGQAASAGSAINQGGQRGSKIHRPPCSLCGKLNHTTEVCFS